ncbi:DUF917 domain-containing protein [Thermococcus sp. CX2]|uniref:DUF917 domain-containing protein n=1 Tax=Thermococcus sp. CX2 TaxID=163006 RepID=UPI00143C90DF|nr:DUF917 domain-containing protein [Thermococcus sp. CX2]NJE85433.1 DUF917 domain-containing protein [Thermococcus sp. CX2]
MQNLKNSGRRLGEDELKDLIAGCTLLGCGGGGSPENGWKWIEQVLRKDREIRLIGVEDLPENAFTVSPYFVGPVGGSPKRNIAALAVLELEEFLGREFGAVVPTELGGNSTAVALATAAELGIPVVDGDMAGRAVPELHHSVYYLHGHKMAPFSIVTPEEDVLIVPRIEDDRRAETLVRAVVSAVGKVGVASHPFDAAVSKRVLLKGTLSRAIAIGRALKSEEWESELMKLGGVLLFRGVCASLERQEERGFTIGLIGLEGIGEFEGERYEILFKNENLLGLRNGSVDVTVPDLITMLTSEGVPVVNSEVRLGEEYVVFGFSAPEVWRSQRGLELLGPRAFGFDVEYAPIARRALR